MSKLQSLLDEKAKLAARLVGINEEISNTNTKDCYEEVDEIFKDIEKFNIPLLLDLNLEFELSLNLNSWASWVEWVVTPKIKNELPRGLKTLVRQSISDVCEDFCAEGFKKLAPEQYKKVLKIEKIQEAIEKAEKNG